MPLPPPIRHPANLFAMTVPPESIRGFMAPCYTPATHVQLLPLRYGLTEGAAPSFEVPYRLQVHPLGVRLIRDGWLYVIEEPTGLLHEYRLEQGFVSDLFCIGAEVTEEVRSTEVGLPYLIFPRTSQLHVAYAEVQWTARKCNQVLASKADREHFMQRVDLRQANAFKGGPHLLTREQAEQWLPELQAPSDTVASPYAWEDPPLFRHAHLGELMRFLQPLQQSDWLFLAVRDDLGVMRDLAAFQDRVIGELDDWREGGEQPGAHERDYVIGCYIESLTRLQELEGLDDPEAQALLTDLAALPEPEQEQTRQALLDYLNIDRDQRRRQRPGDSEHPPELRARLNTIRSTHFPVPDLLERLNAETDQYYLLASADKALIEQHWTTLRRLKKDHDRRIAPHLYGAKFGQRGINDLIDRPAMDASLAEHRDILQRLNHLLDAITADRTQMLTEHRFHRAAWYFDAQQATQLHQALVTQYACLKDIGRCDEANERILAWLEADPANDRPLLHTLPLSVQTELRAQYALLNLSAYGILTGGKEALAQLESLERPHLLALESLQEPTRTLAFSAQATLDPALSHGISRMLDKLLSTLGQTQLPTLDELFRQLPKALSPRLIDAIRREGVTFVVASEREVATLKNDLAETLKVRSEKRVLEGLRERAKREQGHRSAYARDLLERIRLLRQDLALLEPRLVAAMSPVAEVAERAYRVVPVEQGRIGLTLVLADAEQRFGLKMGLRELRSGYAATGSFGKLGDGVGLVVFLTQLVNLIQLGKELYQLPAEQRNLWQMLGPAATTTNAGFSAAQSIANNAVESRITMMGQALQTNAISNARVVLGKLHVSLGVITYTTGLVGSVISAQGHHAAWLTGLRSGNRATQQGALMAMAGAGGYAAANAYGLVQTGKSAYQLLKLLNDPVKLRAAWAMAGTRLSLVFLRFNIAGALFSALELAGLWWLNYNNTSAHDDWLLSTPWGRNSTQRRLGNLQNYQLSLQSVLDRPCIKVDESDSGNSVTLILPFLTQASLEPPIAGRASAQVILRAYRIRVVDHDRGPSTESWSRLETLEARFEQTPTLSLRINPPAVTDYLSSGRLRQDLFLELTTERLDEHGQTRRTEHAIRVRPDVGGIFWPVEHPRSGAIAPALTLGPQGLEAAEDA